MGLEPDVDEEGGHRGCVLDEATSQVEAFDPGALMSFSTRKDIAEVAANAKQRLTAALDHLASQHPHPGSTPDQKF